MQAKARILSIFSFYVHSHLIFTVARGGQVARWIIFLEDADAGYGGRSSLLPTVIIIEVSKIKLMHFLVEY